ncbi:MAG: hypothetical protein JWR27_1206 [Aeromicrobium sp.]|nr:hypothetical protein [Aeromicrobium sp.]
MSDAAPPVTPSAWPPPFSPTYVAQARALLARRHAVVFVGPPDGSSNRLAAAVAGAPEGPYWARHICRYGEQDDNLFVVRQLFDSIRHSGPTSTGAAVQAIRDQLAGDALLPPTVIVGNADLADRASAEVLARLTAENAIKVVATVPPGTIADDWPLLGVAELVEIPPLDVMTVTELLRVRYGREPHRHVAELILDQTGGTYEIVREVADAAVEAGLVIPLEDSLVVAPPRAEARNAFEDRVAPLRSVLPPDGSPEMADLFDLTALIGEIDLAEARAVLDRATIDRALAHGALHARGDGPALSLPAAARFLRRTMPQQRRVELFTTYAARLPISTARPGVAVDVADWWRAAGHPLPQELARRAAREANLGGRHRRALVFTGQDAARVAPIERLYALVELGDSSEVQALLSAVDPTTVSEDDLLPYVCWLKGLAPGAARTRLLDTALRHEDLGVNRRLAAVKTLADLFERVFREGGNGLEGRLRALTFSGLLSPLNRALTFSALSAVQRHAGRPEVAVRSARHALELIAAESRLPNAFHLSVAQESHILALIAAIDLDAADRALRDYLVGPLGRPGSGRMGAALLSMLELARGDLQQAFVNARLALDTLQHHDPHELRGWIEALLAQVLVRQGLNGEAVDMLRVSDSHSSRVLQNDLNRRIAVAGTHDELGDPERALKELAAVRAVAAEHDLRQIEIDAAVLTVRIGGPVHLPALLEIVDELEETSGSPAVWRDFARAAHAYDIPALVAQCRALEGGAPRHAAEIAQYVLDVARRRNDLDAETRSHLQQLAGIEAPLVVAPPARDVLRSQRLR